jgi:cytochrome c biogenesis protein CcdA
MEYLHRLLENSPMPFLSAVILGLMTAISPCPLATNITAIGYISREIEQKKKVFLSGLIYTLGRAFSYTLLGIILYAGASKFHVAKIFQGWGEKILGFVLIAIGILMLDIIKLKLPDFPLFTDKINMSKKSTMIGAFLLGLAFALAFCPYSGVLFFGILIPMSISSASGLYLPAVYALATGLPVIIVSWFLAYSLSGIGTFYNRIKSFEIWFRRIVAVIFIAAGFYYVFIYFFN